MDRLSRRLPASDLADTVTAARRLLGCWLVRRDDAGLRAGRIVETEAYRPDDPASHSHRGLTPRNRAMFGPAGRAYMYVSYGVHHCLNVVTESEGTGAAVLFRALEPLEGQALMEGRRGRPDHLASGPGRLCQAFGLDLSWDGVDLLHGEELFLVAQPPLDAGQIKVTPRIGITKATELPWRFLEAGNPHRSRP